MFALLLFLLFIVVPIAELAVIIQVGQWIGVWPTIGILIADAILGTVLLRTQSRAAWRRFSEALAAGRPPAKEVVDGGLVIFGGALLITPGFLSDILGLLLLLPPTRALLRMALMRRLARGMAVRFGVMGRARPAGHGDVDSTASEIDPRRLRP